MRLPKAQAYTGSASLNALSVDAKSQTVDIGGDRTVVHHAVVFKDLAPDTMYADFWHFVGDLMDNGDQDGEWGELFDAMWIPRTTPIIMLPCNHEYPNRRKVKGADYHLFHLWRPHFTLPENGPAGLGETVYFIDYQGGVRLVMLNGNERLDEQALWLENVLADNPTPWTIVAIHQPMYSTGKYRDSQTWQNLFVPIFDKYRVDLVLQGHDHTYSRGARNENGTVSPAMPSMPWPPHASEPGRYLRQAISWAPTSMWGFRCSISWKALPLKNPKIHASNSPWTSW